MDEGTTENKAATSKDTADKAEKSGVANQAADSQDEEMKDDVPTSTETERGGRPGATEKGPGEAADYSDDQKEFVQNCEFTKVFHQGRDPRKIYHGLKPGPIRDSFVSLVNSLAGRQRVSYIKRIDMRAQLWGDESKIIVRNFEAMNGHKPTTDFMDNLKGISNHVENEGVWEHFMKLSRIVNDGEGGENSTLAQKRKSPCAPSFMTGGDGGGGGVGTEKVGVACDDGMDTSDGKCANTATGGKVDQGSRTTNMSGGNLIPLLGFLEEEKIHNTDPKRRRLVGSSRQPAGLPEPDREEVRKYRTSGSTMFNHMNGVLGSV